MTHQASHEPWLARARSLLEQSAQGLDGSALSRLNRGRQAALEQPVRTRSFWLEGLWSGPGAWGAAASALALSSVLLLGYEQMRPPATSNTGLSIASDADMLAASDDIDLYKDLEFYTWLDAQDEDAHAQNGRG